MISKEKQEEFVKKYEELCRSFGLYLDNEDLHVITINPTLFDEHLIDLKKKIR